MYVLTYYICYINSKQKHLKMSHYYQLLQTAWITAIILIAVFAYALPSDNKKTIN